MVKGKTEAVSVAMQTNRGLLLLHGTERNGTERNTWFHEIPILRNALRTS